MHDRRSSLVWVIRELAEEWFSIDGRIVRTLRVLLRPGALTRQYLDGRRVAYIAPFRLYVLASILLFSSLLALPAPDAQAMNFYIAGELVSGDASQNRGTVRIMEPDSWTARWVLQRFDSKFAELKRRPPQEVLNRLSGGLREALPSVPILFVPILAVALKILYWRRGVLYVDHLVFGVHFQGALFLALAVTWLLVRIFRLGFLLSIVAYLLVFLFMLTVYLARSLYRVYAQRWSITVAKTLVLMLAYFALLQPVVGGAVFLVLWRL